MATHGQRLLKTRKRINGFLLRCKLSHEFIELTNKHKGVVRSHAFEWLAYFALSSEYFHCTLDMLCYLTLVQHFRRLKLWWTFEKLVKLTSSLYLKIRSFTKTINQIQQKNLRKSQLRIVLSMNYLVSFLFWVCSSTVYMVNLFTWRTISGNWHKNQNCVQWLLNFVESKSRIEFFTRLM